MKLGRGYSFVPPYQKLVKKALATSIGYQRRAIFLDGFKAALAKDPPEPWALLVQAEFYQDGADVLLKREHRALAGRFIVKNQGVKLGHSHSVGGVVRRDASGNREYQQALFEYWTWDELRAKLPEYATSVRAYERNMRVIERLLELEHEQQAVGSATPHEACQKLGTTVKDWLATG